MKQRTINIAHDAAKGTALAYISTLPADGTVEVVIRNARKSKTMEQLGGLFANWIKYISDQTGESEDHIHKMLKAKFLARIYIAEPYADLQEMWVERLADIQMSEPRDDAALLKHARRISLSWANCTQMRLYMEAVKNHYIDAGMPLPEMERIT